MEGERMSDLIRGLGGWVGGWCGGMVAGGVG